MRLIDLSPRWFDVPGRGGAIDGVSFLCPHCQKVRLAVQFTPMGVDATLAAAAPAGFPGHEPVLIPLVGLVWTRTGETFDVLTLSPSVDASASGHWHGFVQQGQASL